MALASVFLTEPFLIWEKNTENGNNLIPLDYAWDKTDQQGKDGWFYVTTLSSNKNIV